MSRETLVFRAATLVLALHALDDAVLHRQPGVGLGAHAPAAAVALAAAVAGWLAYPHLRPGLRTALAGSFGALGLVNGAMHVAHVRVDGPAASDLTGLAAAAAGAVLVALAVATPARGFRGLRAGWRARAVAVPSALVLLVLGVAPVGMAVVDSHKWRETIPATPAGFTDVAFRATDGLRLQGWFQPSRNGATVLVVHGGNSDRKGSLAHARMLAAQGYGVLLYDARGRGESEGTPSGFGWGWRADVEGALDFLAGRPEVDPRRIAALGLSTGADALIEVAADRPQLRAVVADGTAAMTWEDVDGTRGPAVERLAGWVTFKAIEVLTGAQKPRRLEHRVAAMEAPLLLISAGRGLEWELSTRYARAAGGPVTHWNLPTVPHTRGLRERPDEYALRVGAFLGAALRR